jgi:hypothetical protein
VWKNVHNQTNQTQNAEHIYTTLARAVNSWNLINHAFHISVSLLRFHARCKSKTAPIKSGISCFVRIHQFTCLHFLTRSAQRGNSIAGHCCFLPSLYIEFVMDGAQTKMRLEWKSEHSKRTVGAAARKNVLLSRPCVLIFASLRIWVDLVKSSERKISADPTRARRPTRFSRWFYARQARTWKWIGVKCEMDTKTEHWETLSFSCFFV